MKGDQMQTSDFIEKIVSPRFKECVMLMATVKDKEYNRYNDKFHNFYRAACIAQVTPETALLGMWMKHIVSILDMIDDIEKEHFVLNEEVLSEKMNDNHNYLFLLEGIIRERFKD